MRAVSGLVDRCQSAAGLKVVIVHKRWVGGRLATWILNCDVSFLMVCLMGGKVFIKVVAFHFELLQLVLGSFAFHIVGKGFCELLFKFKPDIGLLRDHARILDD